MSLSQLSPTLATIKAEYHQDVARLYYELRPLMHSVQLVDEDFISMVQNFSKNYEKQKMRIKRYRFGQEFDPNGNDCLDEDERVENILLDEFIEMISPPPVSTLPKELEILKANLQKDVLIVWNFLDRDGIESFDSKISQLFDKMKQKYIEQRERLRKIMLESDYVVKNVCSTSSDPECIVANGMK